MPSSNLPPLITSNVLDILANMAGFRYVTQRHVTPSFNCFVSFESADRTVHASKQGSRDGPKSGSSKRWSKSHPEWKPSLSASTQTFLRFSYRPSSLPWDVLTPISALNAHASNRQESNLQVRYSHRKETPNNCGCCRKV